LTSLVAEYSIPASRLGGSDGGVGRFGGAARLSVVRIGPRAGMIAARLSVLHCLPGRGIAGAATARGRMNSSTALAKPSSSFEAVT